MLRIRTAWRIEIEQPEGYARCQQQHLWQVETTRRNGLRILHQALLLWFVLLLWIAEMHLHVQVVVTQHSTVCTLVSMW